MSAIQRLSVMPIGGDNGSVPSIQRRSERLKEKQQQSLDGVDICGGTGGGPIRHHEQRQRPRIDPGNGGTQYRKVSDEKVAMYVNAMVGPTVHKSRFVIASTTPFAGATPMSISIPSLKIYNMDLEHVYAPWSDPGGHGRQGSSVSYRAELPAKHTKTLKKKDTVNVSVLCEKSGNQTQWFHLQVQVRKAD